MRTVPAAITTERARGSSRLAKIWRLARLDGVVLRFTEHDRDLVIDGETFVSAAAFDPSTIRTVADMSVSDLDIVGAFDSELITPEDLLAGRYYGASFWVAEVSWFAPEAGKDVLKFGWIGRVKEEGGKFTAELHGPEIRLQQPLLRIHTPGCTAVLGDDRCKEDLGAWTRSGTVSATTNNQSFTGSMEVPSETYYEFGMVTWTSGANIGLSMEVGNATLEGVVSLFAEMPFDIEVNDTFSIVAGCNGSLGACKLKFDNVLNFRGTPHAPVSDDVLKGPVRGTSPNVKQPLPGDGDTDVDDYVPGDGDGGSGGGSSGGSRQVDPRHFAVTKGWADTDGGQGGQIIRVTSTASYGAGTLRAALNVSGPRIIVFETSGVIDLDGERLYLYEPFVTIAGQTAPSPGITIIKGGLEISTHDVIVQHLKVRSGEAGRAKGSGFSMNPIWTVSGAYDVIIDHCSTSWADDENLTVAGWASAGGNLDTWKAGVSRRITLNQNIIAEALRNSTQTSPQSYGTLIMDNAAQILVHGNFYAHNYERNPTFKGGATGAVVNNLTYNPVNQFLAYTLQQSEWTVQGFSAPFPSGQIAAVGNVARAGPSTAVPGYLSVVSNGDVEYYGYDNVATRLDGTSYSQIYNSTYLGAPLGEAVVEVSAPLWPAGLVAKPSGDVEQWVFETVGARPWDRDPHDARVLNHWQTKTGQLINSESDVGGYPPSEENVREFNPALWDLDTMTPLSPDALWEPSAAPADWILLLNESMTVQSVTERFTSGDNYGRIIGSDGSPVPFPDSYAGYVSSAGIRASLEGRSTGLSAGTTSWNGRPLSPPGGDILNFWNGVDAGAIWSWWSTKTGHSAPGSRLRVSDMFFGVYRESSRTWQLLFSGMRVSGVRYRSLFGEPLYGAGEDLSTDPNATIITMPNGYNVEAWCKTTASNPGGYRDFFGRVDREAFADSRSWVIGVKVRVEGSDRANARFIGTVGMDHHRSDYYGDASRYWPSGYPAFVADSGGGEWKDIRNDGEDQWVTAIGCFELARFRGNRPPWGDWGGVWPYSAAPAYGPSWEEILANPPPDYRDL